MELRSLCLPESLFDLHATTSTFGDSHNAISYYLFNNHLANFKVS